MSTHQHPPPAHHNTILQKTTHHNTILQKTTHHNTPHLLQVAQPQVCILQQHPVSLLCCTCYVSTSNHLLTLTHRYSECFQLAPFCQFFYSLGGVGTYVGVGVGWGGVGVGVDVGVGWGGGGCGCGGGVRWCMMYVLYAYVHLEINGCQKPTGPSNLSTTTTRQKIQKYKKTKIQKYEKNKTKNKTTETKTKNKTENLPADKRHTMGVRGLLSASTFSRSTG